MSSPKHANTLLPVLHVDSSDFGGAVSPQGYTRLDLSLPLGGSLTCLEKLRVFSQTILALAAGAGIS